MPMKGMSGGILVGWLLATIGSTPAFAQVEGTYRFVICAEACTSLEPSAAVASGQLVLFSDSSFAQAIPDTALAEIRKQSRRLILPFEPEFNACFRFDQRARRVGGHELFAGIIPRGITRWGVEGGEVEFNFYRSPDGRFTVRAMPGEDQLTGWGEQAHGGDPRPPDRGFLAERIGPARAEACISGDREELQHWR